MKNIIAFIALILLSCTANGQSVTANEDSTKIPVRWYRAATVDLRKFDDCKTEVSLLKESYQTLQQKTGLLEKRNTDLSERTAQLEFRANELESTAAMVDAKNAETIAGLRKQLKTQKLKTSVRSAAMGISATVVTILLLNLINNGTN